VSELLNRRWLRPILLAGIPGLAALVVLLFWLWGGRYISTENAYVKAHIAQISAEIAGRILAVHVHDHAEVKAGDVLFTIDPEPYQVALAKAQAELDSTRSQVRTMVATWHEARSELQEAESKVAYWNTSWHARRPSSGHRLLRS
jgi:membrane fusion protein (multidrug efflux system)